MMTSEPELDVENVEGEVAATPPPPPPEQPAAAAEAPAGAMPPAAGSSGTGTSREPDYSAILGDIDIPEGVDPSFLAALPEDMRQEVIDEQRRLARLRQQPAAAAGGAQARAEPGLA